MKKFILIISALAITLGLFATQLTEPPGPARLIWPRTNEITLMNPMLKWAPNSTGETADSYKVYLNADGIFSEADLIYEGVELEYQSTGLNHGLTYYWKVLPTNLFGSDPSCPTWSFSTPGLDQLAEGFEDGVPPLGWVNINSSKKWIRSSSNNVEGRYSAYKSGLPTANYIISTPLLSIVDGSTLQFFAAGSTVAASLEIVYSVDRNNWTQIGATITHSATNTPSPFTYDLSSLAGGDYYIGFSTGRARGNSYIDHVIGPDLTPVIPGIPTLTAPDDAASNLTAHPEFTWTADDTAGVPSGYNIYMDTIDGSTLYDTCDHRSYIATPALAWGSTYYWKVTAFNSVGESDASSVRSFTVMSDPTIYDLPWMEDFGTVIADWPALNWTQYFGLYPEPLPSTTTQWSRANWLNGPAGDNAPKIKITGTATRGWLVTPPIAIPTDEYELKFDIALTQVNSDLPIADDEAQQDDRFLVVMSDSPDMEDPTILREWNNTDSEYVFNSIPHTSENVRIPLTGISGNKYFAFYAESRVAGDENDLYIDNVSVRELTAGPPEPVTLVSPEDEATALPIEGFELSWYPALTGGEPLEYSVFMSQDENTLYEDHFWYGITDLAFDPTQAALNPISYNYNETWYWSVMAVNGDGETIQETPYSFTIMVDPRIMSLPYSQNFDGVPSPGLPAAWTGYVNAASDYAVVQTSTAEAVSPPNSVNLQNAHDTAADLRLITPEILVPINTIKLSFSALAGNPNYTLLVGTVDALDGTGTFNQMASVALSETYTTHTVSFASYVGDDQYICFKHGLGSTFRNIYIDDVSLEELIANDLEVVSLTGAPYAFPNTETTHTVTVRNNGSVAQNSYTVYLKNVDGDAIIASATITEELLPEATKAVNITWTTVELGGIQLYGEVVLIGDAVPDNNVSDIMTFNTYHENTLFEGFEAGVIPANWTVLNLDGGNQRWSAKTTNPHTGTYSAYVRYETMALDNDDWLITPALQLTSTTPDNISFWMRTYSSTSSDPWEVLISTTDTDPASFTMIDSGSGRLGGYVQKSYNLDSYGDAVVYLAIRYLGSYDRELYVDDFIAPPIYVPVEMEQPVVSISKSGNRVVLNWDIVPYANSYQILAADAPEGPYTLLSTVSENSYSTSTASKKFYQIKASTETPAETMTP